ncbi:MAG: ferredoxin [Gemmatimonadota bacterium]
MSQADHSCADGAPQTCHTFGDLRVEIDRTLCVGFGDCVQAAPETFELDEEDVAVFKPGAAPDRERLIRACAECPVDAITVIDGEGVTLVP